MANPAMPERLRLSKGVHLLLPVEAIQSEAALLVPKTADGRVIFAIPWLGRLLVGTTEDEAQLTDEMVVTPEEIGYLLGYVNQYLKVKLTPDDVLAGFAGLRPLVKSKDRVKTRKLIRDHEIEVDEGSGLVSVLGGKWTTYRAMAEDGIDCAERAIAGEKTECKTLEFALTGAEGFWAGYWKQLAERYCLAWGASRHLAEKFGTDAPKVMELAEQDARLREPLFEGGAAIRAEVVYVIREEMAQSIEDVLLRRIGVQFHSWKGAARAAPVVCQLLAEELDWSEAQSREALDGYLASIRHLLDSAGLDGRGISKPIPFA
jgi:glycerol-3-phosphate dehydrogenase